MFDGFHDYPAGNVGDVLDAGYKMEWGVSEVHGGSAFCGTSSVDTLRCRITSKNINESH